MIFGYIRILFGITKIDRKNRICKFDIIISMVELMINFSLILQKLY